MHIERLILDVKDDKKKKRCRTSINIFADIIYLFYFYHKFSHLQNVDKKKALILFLIIRNNIPYKITRTLKKLKSVGYD
jgi:hypothetical protein